MGELQRLKVGRKFYKIEHKDLGGADYGMMRPWKRPLIEIDDGLTNKEQVYATVHETLHAVWDYKKIPERAREERVVTDLAWGLTQVFIDNPGLLAHLEKLLKQER
jgi:hypothetical protein